MKEFFKNIIAALILLTLAYVIFVATNVYIFVKSDESKLTPAQYSEQISLLKEELETAKAKFSQNNIKDSSENLNINYDGTPIVWVIELDQSEFKVPLKNIEIDLFNQGFMTFMAEDKLFVGPYIDKSNFDFIQNFLKKNYGISPKEIIKWKN